MEGNHCWPHRPQLGVGCFSVLALQSSSVMAKEAKNVKSRGKDKKLFLNSCKFFAVFLQKGVKNEDFVKLGGSIE